MMSLRDQFVTLPPTEGNKASFKVIVAVFPDVTGEQAFEFIDGVKAELLPTFMAEGLSIDSFHPLSEQQGSHDPNARLKRSPLSLLLIRYLV